MTIEEKLRSAEFRMAYWASAEELAPLLTPADQRKMLDAAATANFGRKDVKRIAQRMAGGTGPLSIDDADRVCKRYGLWTVRRKRDWGRHDPGWLDASTKAVDDALTRGIYDLDVGLRRQVDARLLTRR